MKGKKLITTICIVCVLAILLCIPAFATVTESDGDGYALYNGVKLSDIDTVWTDKVTYPYAVVYYSGSFNKYQLYLFDEYAKYQDDSIAKLNFYRNVQWYDLDDTWVLKGEYSTGLVVSSFVNVWTSVDIYYSSNNSTLYLAASEPIPLDGYNVIEWDGDTTGLTAWGDNHFIIGDSVDFNSGVAVFDNVGTLYVTMEMLVEGNMSGLVYGDEAVVVNIPDTGLAFFYSSNGTSTIYATLFAYRSTETPPDEGGGDDDDPQPPAGG